MSQPTAKRPRAVREDLDRALSDLDQALVSLCQGEAPQGYQRDPEDARAAQSVKEGILDNQRNWCHDD